MKQLLSTVSSSSADSSSVESVEELTNQFNNLTTKTDDDESINDDYDQEERRFPEKIISNFTCRQCYRVHQGPAIFEGIYEDGEKEDTNKMGHYISATYKCEGLECNCGFYIEEEEETYDGTLYGEVLLDSLDFPSPELSSSKDIKYEFPFFKSDKGEIFEMCLPYQEKGDCILFRYNEMAICIDTGFKKYVKNVPLELLSKYDYKLLLVTHCDNDHSGAAKEFLLGLKGCHLLYVDVPDDVEEKIYEEVDFKVATREDVEKTVYFNYGGLKISSYLPRAKESNDKSLITLFHFQDKYLVFTGDQNYDVVYSYLKEKGIVQLHLLQIPHHGSKHNWSSKAVLVPSRKYLVTGYPTAQSGCKSSYESHEFILDKVFEMLEKYPKFGNVEIIFTKPKVNKEYWKKWKRNPLSGRLIYTVHPRTTEFNDILKK